MKDSHCPDLGNIPLYDCRNIIINIKFIFRLFQKNEEDKGAVFAWKCDDRIYPVSHAHGILLVGHFDGSFEVFARETIKQYRVSSVYWMSIAVLFKNR